MNRLRLSRTATSPERAPETAGPRFFIMDRSFYSQWFDNRWPVWAAGIMKLASGLIRTELVGMGDMPAPGAPYAVAHWHGDELALMPHFGGLGLTILVSHSRDGEIMARGARVLGYRVTRGSSTRGAVGGLLALIRALRRDHPVVLAVDGPQGPRGVCKPGIVMLAQKTGVPLFPVGVAVTRRYVFEKSWNRAYIPLPFSRQVILVDKPLLFPRKADPEEMDRYCRQVEESIRSAQKKAHMILSGHDSFSGSKFRMAPRKVGRFLRK
ncbi:MAG: lysophospholipid acyltransferase family protein [Deltaproteobacteria bacterium]|nr:lysophospholipid acyltransferase family protein [Deltaproteobacteria bacterium]